MPGRLRHVIAEGVAAIIKSVPDEATVIVQIQNIDRDVFDQLRRGAEVVYLPLSEIWTSLVPLGGGVMLELETRDEPGLRAVS